MEEMQKVSASHLFFIPRSSSACGYRGSQSPFAGPCGAGLGTVLLVHGHRNRARRGQLLGGGTALGVLPKSSAAEGEECSSTKSMPENI